MGLIESMLIRGGEMARSAWDAIAAAMGWVFGLIHAVLNPVLAPVLSLLNTVCTFLGDILYGALGLLPGWLGLTILSGGLGIVMLIAFRYTSNQARIKQAKDAIKANLLALKLYKDDLRVTFKTQFRLLAAVARLQRYILFPVLVMTLPMLLLFAQMAARHQWQPLRPGEATIVRARLADRPGPEWAAVKLEGGPGVSVEVGPLPGEIDVVWRVRGVSAGRHILRIITPGMEYEKELVVGEPLDRVSAVRPSKHWGLQLLYPIERAIPAGAAVQSIEVEYRPLKHWYYGSDWWIVSLLVVSMVVAFIFRSAFGVTF